MKIYADLRWPDKTGIGVVKTELLKRMPAGYDLHDLGVSTRIGNPWSPFALGSAVARQCRGQHGLFWSPGFVPPSNTTLPAVVTVHDLLHLHYYSRFHVAYYNMVFKPMYRRCRAVISDSDFSRNEFLEWSGFPPERCFTVHLGVSSAFHNPARHATPPYEHPYVLYPGNRRVYKNLPRLMQAYGRSRLPRNGVKLLLTGRPDAATLKKAAEAGITGHLIFAGFVDEDTLVNLYRHAAAITFVSLYEGFGLPIVEGMAAGVPVLTSNTSSMAEIAGDAALVVDPYSVDAISAGLDELVFNEGSRSALIRLGHERVRRFDWEVAAQKVWAVLDQVALQA